MPNRPVLLSLALLTFIGVIGIAATASAEEKNAMPPVPPTVEEVLQKNKELIPESDLVARLRVESVDRVMSYGGVCIEIHSSWYVARCHVVKTLHGDLPADAETVDVLFTAKSTATVLGFYLPPERRKGDGFANQTALERRPSKMGKPEPFEFVAFLRSTPVLAPLKPKEDGPKLFLPTPGYGRPESALTSLGRLKVINLE